MMNYIKISRCDTANGIGIRTTLWVSGCIHKCKGCHNQNTWDINTGTLFTEDTMRELLDSLSPSYVKGLTLSGGDPLHPDNRDQIYAIARVVKNNYPNKDIWLYTGYDYEEVSHLDIMKYIDVLVDGKYIDELRDLRLKYRGSSNQRIILLDNHIPISLDITDRI